MTFSFTGIARSILVLSAFALAWLWAPAHAAADPAGDVSTVGALASRHQRALDELRYVEYEAYLERRCQGDKTERITVIGKVNLDGWSQTISHIVAGADGSAKLTVEYFIRDNIPFRQIEIDSALYPGNTHANPEPRTATIDVFTSESPLHPSYVFTAFIDSSMAMRQEPDTLDAARCTGYRSDTDQGILTLCLDPRTGFARDVRIEQQDNPATGACRLSAHAAYTPVAGPPAAEPSSAVMSLYKKETHKAGLDPKIEPAGAVQTVPGMCIFPDKPAALEFFSPADGLPDAPVTAMMFDGSGALWAGTRKGIARRAQGAWNTFTAGGKLFGTPVTDFIFRPDGVLWAATPSGIYTYDGKRWDVLTTSNGLPDNNVMSLAASPDGRDVWAGTMRGLGRFRDGAWKIYTTQNGLPDNDISALAMDSSGALWAGTVKGLARFSNGHFLDLGKDAPVADQFIKVLSATPDGNLWVVAGTQPGILSGNAGRWIQHTGAEGLPCAHVAHVTADRNGCVWAACLDIFDTSPALVYFDGVKWHTFNQGAADHPYLIAPAPDGSLWAATARGIMHIVF